MKPTTPLVLLVITFVISLCGLGYELLAGTITSYFLGNSILQFSLTIGIFLFAMGLGSYLSGRIEKNVAGAFVLAQVLIAVAGGFFSLVMFSVYTFAESSFYVAFFLLLLIVGGLIGLEIPLLIRLVNEYRSLNTAVAQVLAVDYCGALAASILFPLLLLPHLGLMKASFLYGLLNIVVAFLFMNLFRNSIQSLRPLFAASVISVLLLFGGFFYSFRLTGFFENRMFADEIILTRQTKYQRIVLTRNREDLRLYLDGNLQFCSLDEYRYHEVLVHPAMSAALHREQVLILGGGDGLAAREVLKYPGVKHVTLVDLDSEIVKLCRTNTLIAGLNRGSLGDARMEVIIEDAFTWLSRNPGLYDVIIADFPDPNNESIGKLYSTQFYQMVRQHCAKGAMVSVQATSPFFARSAFWCIVNTVRDAGFSAEPLHVNVPSFGEWGFVLASPLPVKLERISLQVPVRYLNPAVLASLFSFPDDISPVSTEINTLDNPVLLTYYLEGWSQWE
ncbi:MAG: polyamine aminopropyltransferase [Candidatus Eremiobacteraeota bacterium]|nr:polyamine aminopropyltransferase [Candidatus Eremiobacteraeota bacterium]